MAWGAMLAQGGKGLGPSDYSPNHQSLGKFGDDSKEDSDCRNTIPANNMIAELESLTIAAAVAVIVVSSAVWGCCC